MIRHEIRRYEAVNEKRVVGAWKKKKCKYKKIKEKYVIKAKNLKNQYINEKAYQKELKMNKKINHEEHILGLLAISLKGKNVN